MADNVTVGGVLYSTDEIATLNGTPGTYGQAQRIKNGFGPDGAFTDVTPTTPFPAVTPSATVTGTVTAVNASPTSGAGTAGSSVTLTIPDGHTSYTFTLGGTFSAGTMLAFQCSIDGVDWYYTNARRNMNALGANEFVSTISTDVIGGAPAGGGGNPSMWKGTAGAIRYFRVTCLTFAASDSVNVSIMSSAGTGGTFQLGSLPAGTSNIGTVGAAPAPTGTPSSVALTTSSATALAANSSRRMATFYNDSTVTAYLACFTPATTTSFTVPILAGGYYELPGSNTVYTGIVTVIASAANGNLRITEFT